MRTDFTKAVVLCGHAIYVGGPPLTDAAYILEGYQRDQGSIFFKHVRQFCMEIDRRGKDVLGIISGGQTRDDPRCIMPESVSYHLLAAQSGYFGLPIEDRVTTEWFSVDSVSNIAYSLARFWEVCRRLPDHVCVLSLNHKERRIKKHFDDCLAAAGLTGTIEFEFVGGLDLPREVLERALQAEARIFSEFQQASFGTNELVAKRVSRNPFSRTPVFEISNSPLVPLFLQLHAIQGT